MHIILAKPLHRAYNEQKHGLKHYRQNELLQNQKMESNHENDL